MARQLTLEQLCKISAWQEVFQFSARLEKLYGRYTAPTCNAIYAIHGKFLETGSVLDKPCRGKPASTTTDENAEFKEQVFKQSQGKSIQKAALELGINKSLI
uniref:Transposase n=1 Tax=Pyxicephalus adspersus TaxID=30357 RepID=A0AAV3A7P9_PYXAD|nr:TPA: hypothetical protein GDO54_011375 [Pyxicephalus adspersus]